jgi:hypothetical protein
MKGHPMSPEERTATWQRPVKTRFATIIKQNRMISAIANIETVDPQPQFLDKNTGAILRNR